jgi:hypothetical protein
MSFYTDNEDIRFYFERAIPWEKLISSSRYKNRERAFATNEEAIEFYREVGASVGELVAKELAPRVAKIDHEGATLSGGEAHDSPELAAAFRAFKDAELHKMCIPTELGGLDVPLIVYFLGGEMIARADVSAMTHFSFHGGMGLAMLWYSIQEGTTKIDASGIDFANTRFASYVQEIARGEAWGSMDITEPNAGSDMAALRMRAEQGPDGVYRLTGQKIFITSGHGKFHFVVARTEETTDANDPMAGLGGLSMFLVKGYDDLPSGERKRYVTIERVEEKLGHHGSVTAALNFDNVPGELIGKRGEGFRYMLTLMNGARVGVGFEAIGLSECALRMARAYAEERRSMGKAIARHEMIADYLDEMELDVKALRALAVTCALNEELAQKLFMFGEAGDGTDEERAQARKEMARKKQDGRRLTPLLKYAATEKALEIARRNMQIHGGVGYTKEYGAERLLRDALVLPVYEGTSQIQSLMAMKDTLGDIMKRPQAFAKRIAEARWKSLSARDPLEKRLARMESLSLSAQQHLLTRTAKDKLKTLAKEPVSAWAGALKKDWDPKRDFARAMLHAERLTRILADVAIAEILFEQGEKWPERRELCERWLDRAELRVRAMHEEITTTGDKLLAKLEASEQHEVRAAAE